MTDVRFLVVRLGSLGDIVHTLPAVAALRESFPLAEIVWLTHPRWVELVSSSQLTTEIWPVNSRDFSQVRSVLKNIHTCKWTAAIDYQGLWKSASLPFLGGVPRRIGFSSATIREFGVPILYTDRVAVKATHIADQNGELSLRAGASKPVSDFTLHINPQHDLQVRSQLSEKGIDRYIVLSPGGGWRSKCWPPERFGALCKKIRDDMGISCVVNYGPGEESLLTAVQRASGNANPIPYNADLLSLMALLRNALCIVGGDTGPLHLGVALGTRAIGLFGPTDPVRNGPYCPEPTVLRSPSAVTSYKRGDVTDPSLLDISVDQVFDAVARRLEQAA
ncbi:MAG: glycosyltransferase family 9 protein [Candidatus Acidiferrum sp.]